MGKDYQQDPVRIMFGGIQDGQRDLPFVMALLPQCDVNSNLKWWSDLMEISHGKVRGVCMCVRMCVCVCG